MRYLLALLVLVPAPAFANWEDYLLAGVGISDLISTERLIGHPHISEANPLMQSRATRIAVKAGSTAGIIWIANKLDKEHPTAAAVVRWTTISMWSSATGWNIYLGVKIQ